MATNVSFSYVVFPIMLSQRSKRKVAATNESQTITLGPDEVNFTYADTCPHIDSLILCPYSQYCFSVITLFAFKGIHIDASDPAVTTVCIDTSETGEFTIFIA